MFFTSLEVLKKKPLMIIRKSRYTFYHLINDVINFRCILEQHLLQTKHFNVRESAWADVRKSIIRNLPESIAILSTWAMDSDSYSRYFMPASNSNNIFLAASPPPYPVNLWLLPITRWQGTNMEMGFVSLAAATARMALGLFNLCDSFA